MTTTRRDSERPRCFVESPDAAAIAETPWPTPIGDILVGGSGSTLTMLRLPESSGYGPVRPDEATEIEPILGQLDEYFSGERTDFSVALAPTGTVFQLAVWEALLAIPYASTASYGEIAATIGSPRGGRAVGMANNRNPIAIVVPCHRVIGADGSLVGYGGGLGIKQWLLEHEQLVAEREVGRLAIPVRPTACNA